MKKQKLQISRFVPCSVVLLTVAAKGKKDAMTASAMFVSEDPPLLTVSVAKHIASHDLIEQAGGFVLNLASKDQVKLARQIGFTHGKEVNKFKKFRIPKERESRFGPSLKGSFASLECKVITSLSAANYVVYLTEVIGHKVNNELKPIAWFANKFFGLEQEIR